MPKKLKRKTQQGVRYTEEEREKILQILKPFLQLGYDLYNSCLLAEQPYTTIINWVNKDVLLCNKIKSWQNMVNAKARQNVVKAINENDVQESKWWLERREKKQFSPRQEMTGADGQPIEVISQEKAKNISKIFNDNLLNNES